MIEIMEEPNNRDNEKLVDLVLNWYIKEAEKNKKLKRENKKLRRDLTLVKLEFDDFIENNN